MNNWRLLLLALVAVFQPIASFTERGVIDGRHQCCDRLASGPLRDTRSLFHGTYGETTSAQQRLNDRDGIREDQRGELKDRIFVFSRPSAERPLTDVRERGARQGPSVIDRSFRAEYRLESRERSLNIQGGDRNIRQSSRVVDRTSRNGLERRNARTYTQSSFETRRKIRREQIRSGDQRFTLNRDARRVLSRAKDASMEAPKIMDNRQDVPKERLSEVRRESSVRVDTRLFIDEKNVRRDLERNGEVRRSLSENTRLVDRIRDMRLRVNTRDDNRKQISTIQRLSAERFGEHREQRNYRKESRLQNRENIDRTLSGEQMQMGRRITRESRMMNTINTHNERDVDSRRVITRTERVSRDTRHQNRENLERQVSRERIQIDRRLTRESRNERDEDNRRDIKHNERMSRATRDEVRENIEQRLSQERNLMEGRNIRAYRIINARNNRNEMIRETRGRIRQNLELERIQMERRDARESRDNSKDRRMVRRENQNNQILIRNIRDNYRLPMEGAQTNRRNIKHNVNEREIRYRIARENRAENRFSEARVQMEQRDSREFRMSNDDKRNIIISRPEIRYTEERSAEIRGNPEQRISRERLHMDRRNTREIRKMNERLPSENTENPDHRLSRERLQSDQRRERESRTVNSLHERDMNSRQEIRNERLSRETRKDNLRKLGRNLTRETLNNDRRDIRQSRNVRDVDSRREIRNNDLSRQIRVEISRQRQVESRSHSRVTMARENNVRDRRAHSADRLNFREIRAEPRLSRSADVDRRTEVFRNRAEQTRIENRERESTDARFRNVELTRSRERISPVMGGKTETENDSTVANWQYVLYTLQAAYLCALFMQMLTPSRTEKPRKMSLRWLPISSHYNPIKVD